MHDPMTVAWEIKSPIKRKSSLFPEGYRSTLITIWHVDPERDGSDDSCGWFKRARHGDKKVLEKIAKRFEEEWDRTWTYDPEEHGGDEEEEKRGKITYDCGYFTPTGMPRYSVSGIVLNLMFVVAQEHFNSNGLTNFKKAKSFMRRNLLDILIFAENTTDSLFDALTLKFGNDDRRDERIRAISEVCYGYILRTERKWWKHPRWHFHHWKIQIHFVQTLKRWLFSRCCKCGKRFSWAYSPCSSSWNGTGPKWFRSEEHVCHSECLEMKETA